jgi:hypothetical protein
MVATGELQSERYEKLCEALGCDSPGDQFRVFGHLHAWREKWAREPEMDGGILWEATTHRMGMWAAWPSPKAFGCALVKAGYVTPLSDVYPAELLRDGAGRARGGYVAMGYDGRPSLETSWSGVQRVSARRNEWVLFLLDADRRWRQCAAMRVPIRDLASAGRVPPAWADEYAAWCGARRLQGVGGMPPDEADSPADDWPSHETALERSHETAHETTLLASRNVSPRKSVNDEYQSVVSHCVPFPVNVGSGRGFAPPPHVRKEKGTEGREQTGSEPRNGRGTGAPKSERLYAVVDDLRHTDLLATLRAIDGGEAAMVVWRSAASAHASVVSQVLAELLTAWSGIRNPAGWVMKRLYPLYERRGRNTVRGRGEAPTRTQAAAG